MVRLLAPLIIWLSLLGQAQAASLIAEVDRQQLGSDEHLLFTLKLINSDTRLRVEGVKPNVDLTLLSEDFDIGSPKLDNHYNIYQGQGRSTSQVSVELFPRRSGRLQIPVFEVDGLRSQAITIEVRNEDKTLPPEVFARTGSNRQQLWAGQQLLVYIDLYHRVSLDKAAMGDMPSSEPVDMDLLTHWKLPQASRQEKVDGLDYEVERIGWAIFPDQAGALHITLPDIWVTTASGRQQRLPFQTLTFEIRPLPAGLPADLIIGKPELRLSQALPEQINAQQLSQWTINLRAPVPVTSLPRYLPGISMPDGLKLYMDAANYHTERSQHGIIDDADYTLSIMPLQAGNYELPAIRIPYFDPDNGQASYVELPGRSLRVNPAETVVPAPPSAGETLAEARTDTTDASLGPWQLSTLGFALLWLVTLALWRRQYGNPAAAPAPTPTTGATSPSDPRPPLQQQLLQILGGQTLEAGLQSWQAQLPQEDAQALGETVRAVQRHYYGTEKLGEDALKAHIKQAGQIIASHTQMTNRQPRSNWQQALLTK